MARTVDPHWEGADWRIGPAQIEAALSGAGWPALFEGCAPEAFRLHVDVGFGRGEFIADLASRDPEGAYLGIERSRKRVLKVAKRLAKTEIRNVRVLEAEAQWVFREALPAASVTSVWVNFPDPWPKRRHAARRLLDRDFLADVVRVLAPGGSFQFATDHAPYAEHADCLLAAEASLVNVHAPDRFQKERPELLQTAYEREWREQHRDCFYFHYRRVAPTPTAPLRGA